MKWTNYYPVPCPGFQTRGDMIGVGKFTKILMMQNSLETGFKEDHGAISHNNTATRIIEGVDPGVRRHLKNIYIFLNS